MILPPLFIASVGPPTRKMPFGPRYSQSILGLQGADNGPGLPIHASECWGKVRLLGSPCCDLLTECAANVSSGRYSCVAGG